ncbi:MAG: beta-ketoacyl-ACP synthase [Myxococcales bacterium]|nr:beta-ketoacyl-ACP synthase [Myxococcales bacterium]
MRRAVITGVGLHTPLGDDRIELFDRILAGDSGVAPMPDWASVDGLSTRVSAPVRGFTGKHLPRTVRRTMGRVSMMAASAAAKAAEDAGLDEATLTGGRTAVVVGSTGGSGDAEQEFWGRFVKTRSMQGLRATLFFRAMSHTCAANVALHLGITGELLSTNSACASSNQALGVAVERIRLNKADVVVAGGAEELHVTSGIIFDGLHAATTAFNDDPDRTPRPFDAARDGIVVGEGAGIVVVEELEHAKARGATILAEIVGYGTTCDAVHMSGAKPEGMVAAIERCLADAGVSVGDVDYINAHATATVAGDHAEAEALHRLFADRVPVSSSKGHLGHTLGACGCIESVVCVEALRRGIVPATRNLQEPNVAPIDHVTTPREQPLSHVLNTNFAFGGVNSVLLIAKAGVR